MRDRNRAAEQQGQHETVYESHCNSSGAGNDLGGKKMKSIEAWGNGGQFLIIIPEIDMTITLTGGNYNVYPEMERGFKLLEQYIFPAVKL